MNRERAEKSSEPGMAMLGARLVQVAGIFIGAAATVWTFLYLFGLSMEYDHAEKLTALIPASGLILYLYSVKRHSGPNFRWAFLEFFAASLVSYLLLQFVIVNLI